MGIIIDLPEPILAALEIRAAEERISVENIILKTLERELVAPFLPSTTTADRLQLPLLRSSNPGAMKSLTNAEVDQLLG